MVVADALQSASRTQLEEAVAGLMMGYPSMRGLSKIEAQILVRKYADDLEGVPLWAIHVACKDISRGIVSDLNPDFAPSAARVRQQADEHMERIEREARDLRLVLNAPVLPPEDPEMRERIKFKFKELRQHMHRNAIPEQPIEPKFKAPTAEEIRAHYSSHNLEFVPKDGE